MNKRTLPYCGNAMIQRGFTLIEVMVVVAIVAILLSIAAPNLVAFQRNSELRSTASGFLAAVQLARAEAMKRGVDTYMIPAAGGSWANGWIVFADTDLSQTLNTAVDTVIMQTGAIASKTAVVTGSANATAFADGSSSYIRFNGGGFSMATDNAFRSGAIEFSVTGSTETRRVVLNNVGRARLCDPAKDTTTACKQ